MSFPHSPIAARVEGKEFSCSFCHREFRRLEHLQRHTRRHTHEKPFSCSCGDAFSRRDLLRRHERMTHGLYNNVSPRSLNAPASTGSQQRTTESGHIPHNRQPSQHTEQNAGSTQQFIPAYPRAWPQIRTQQSSLTESTPLRGRFAELEQLLGVDGDIGEIPHEDSVPSNGRNHDTSLIIGPPVEVNIPVSVYANRESTRPPHQQPTLFPSPPVALGAQIVPHVPHPIVTESQRQRLLQVLEGTMPQGVMLPSSDALTRFLAGYFTGFYPHMPFTHAPTFKLEACSPQLSLAMLALGAANRYELSSATKLYYLSKAVLADQQHQRESAMIEKLTGPGKTNSLPENDYVDDLRCLLCLSWFSTWQEEKYLRDDSLILRGVLAQTLRLSGLEEASQSQVSWEAWALQESARRTKLLAFCFLNTQSIAFDLPPMVWIYELNLLLPCTCPEWTAPDSTTWGLLRDNMPWRQGYFQDALNGLLNSEQDNTERCIPTPVANYVLLHGLIHGIISTEVFPKTLGSIPSPHYRTLFKNALRRWTMFWQRTPESNLEPLDPNGPLPFTSSALLRLAYIRICSCFTKLGSRNLQSWSPVGIADILRASPLGDRNRSELLAAQHASHILEILIKLGIQYVKHNQALVWNIEAALCGFECAVFLEKWLRALHHGIGNKPLSEPEQLLLQWIQDIISEGLMSTDHPGDTSDPSGLHVLADRVVDIWSDIMRGNSPWAFISMLGDALVEYRKASGTA